MARGVTTKSSLKGVPERMGGKNGFQDIFWTYSDRLM
jgi:hypothetical protein